MMNRIKLTNFFDELQLTKHLPKIWKKKKKKKKKKKGKADTRIHEQMNFGTSTEKTMTNTPIVLNCEMNFCG